ncbi:MAG: hypothetical protein H0X42_04370 [Solirubrobacterales bacterium]|nr:hypothetical protein [Solirubrobacterales bacterium]
MRRRLAKAALDLYPLAFRRRYGDEMLALIEEAPPSSKTTLDLLRGAFLAHVRPAAGLAAALSPEERLRGATAGILSCWIAFAAAGFGFYKTTEDHPFSRAGDSHPAIGGAHTAIQILAVIASLAVIAGALPLIVPALRQARRVRSLRRATGLAAGALALFAIATLGLVALAHSTRSLPGPAAGLAFLAWALVGLLSGTACAFAARSGLFALRVRRSGLVAALACGTLVTAAMALIATATGVYVFALALDASTLAGQGNGPSGLLSAGASIGFQLLVMIAAAGLASVTLYRGWSAVGSSRSGSSPVSSST